eukprot:2254076-Prymnesium_polylepis.1
MTTRCAESCAAHLRPFRRSVARAFRPPSMPQPEEQRKQPQPEFWGCAQAIAAQMNMEAKRLKSAGTATDE